MVVVYHIWVYEVELHKPTIIFDLMHTDMMLAVTLLSIEIYTDRSPVLKFSGGSLFLLRSIHSLLYQRRHILLARLITEPPLLLYHLRYVNPQATGEASKAQVELEVYCRWSTVYVAVARDHARYK